MLSQPASSQAPKTYLPRCLDIIREILRGLEGKRAYFIKGAKQSESNHSYNGFVYAQAENLNKFVDEMAEHITRTLQLEQASPEDDSLDPPRPDVNNTMNKTASDSFAREVVPWNDLSTEEQEACVGAPRPITIRSDACFLPEGPLDKLWTSDCFQ
jgi:hypothetical protein